MNEPKVSIVVATLNSGRTIERCLESVCRQTHPRVELIVVDNSSSDDTVAIARRFADVVVQRGPERSAQRNAGAAAASGEFLLFIDADMILDSDVVSACVGTWREQPAIVWIEEESFGEGYWARCKAFERSFYRDDSLVAGARFFERSVFMEIGGYDESLHATEDWDVSMRAEALRPLRKTTARILHDEGRLRMLQTLRKKFYYGANHPAFLAKHGEAARKRLSPWRASLFRNAPAMLRRPTLGVGVFTMKAGEFVASYLGRFLARPAKQQMTIYGSDLDSSGRMRS